MWSWSVDEGQRLYIYETGLNNSSLVHHGDLFLPRPDSEGSRYFNSAIRVGSGSKSVSRQPLPSPRDGLIPVYSRTE